VKDHQYEIKIARRRKMGPRTREVGDFGGGRGFDWICGAVW